MVDRWGAGVTLWRRPNAGERDDLEQADCLALVAVPCGGAFAGAAQAGNRGRLARVGRWQERAGWKALGRVGNGRLAGRSFMGWLAAGIALAGEAGTGWRSGGAPLLVG